MNKKTAWFSAFRTIIPADYESWLERLALEGWNIDKLQALSVFRMTFRKTEPKRYRYVYDLNIAAMLKQKDYRQTYEQFGWEYVGRLNANTFLWRKEYGDARPEAFTDRESLIQRNQRMLFPTIAGLVLVLAALILALVGIGVCLAIGEQEKAPDLAFCAALMAVLSLFVGWVVHKLRRNLER
jgi:hypothetical protein